MFQKKSQEYVYIKKSLHKVPRTDSRTGLFTGPAWIMDQGLRREAPGWVAEFQTWPRQPPGGRTVPPHNPSPRRWCTAECPPGRTREAAPGYAT
jgi:hypothetical protein